MTSQRKKNGEMKKWEKGKEETDEESAPSTRGRAGRPGKDGDLVFACRTGSPKPRGRESMLGGS